MLMLTLAAVAPALILLWYVYHKDTEPEPTRLIFKGFCYGGLAVLAIGSVLGPAGAIAAGLSYAAAEIAVEETT